MPCMAQALTAGLMGVSFQHGGYKATIKVGGRKKHLGTFRTAEEAHRVYAAERARLFPECAL